MIHVDTPAMRLELTSESGRLVGALATGTLGIRPEDIDLAGEAPAPGRAVVAAEVSYVEPMGGEALLGLIVGGQELVARVRQHRGVRPGERVDAVIDTGRAYLFDGETEKLALAPR